MTRSFHKIPPSQKEVKDNDKIWGVMWAIGFLALVGIGAIVYCVIKNI